MGVWQPGKENLGLVRALELGAVEQCLHIAHHPLGTFKARVPVYA